MQDQPDKVRLASDKLFELDEEVRRKALEQFRYDRLAVLHLTERDKKFLKDLRISVGEYHVVD